MPDSSMLKIFSDFPLRSLTVSIDDRSLNNCLERFMRKVLVESTTVIEALQD